MLFPSDPMGQFIFNIIIALIGLSLNAFAALVGYLFYTRRFPRKAITYTVKADRTVITRNAFITHGTFNKTLSIGEEVQDEDIKTMLEILFNQHPVSDIQQVILRIRNSGNLGIVQEDYTDDIEFKFGAKILNAKISNDPDEVFKVRPDSAQPRFQISAEGVKMCPTLLNPKEWFELKVLLTQFKGKIDAKVRFRDGERMRRSNFAELSRIAKSMEKTASLVGIIFSCFLLALLISSILKIRVGDQYTDLIFAGGLILVWFLRTSVWLIHTWDQQRNKIFSVVSVVLLFLILLSAYFGFHDFLFALFSR
ncbi:MAG TPA: hypothetical protein VKV20_03555 [Ktedonobacteraceae bacterium]|nr:hypothetical protein [Ktedonobacteraceae bacterium]